MHTLTTLISIVLKVLARATRQKKQIKGIQMGNDEIKVPVFAGDMILYVENPKDSTKNLLEMLNKYEKVAGHKINAQKPTASLYTNNEISDIETNTHKNQILLLQPKQ